MRTVRTRLRELILILLCVLGVADTLFMYVQEERGVVGQFCAALGGSFGADCEKVLTSQYSEVFGLKLTLLGILYYVSLLWMSVWARFESVRGGGRAAEIFLAAGSAVGFAVSMYLTYLQAALIKAWCPFCLASAAITTLILILSLVGLLRRPSPQLPAPPAEPAPGFGGLLFLCVLLSSGLAVVVLSRAPERPASTLEQMMRYVPRRTTPAGGAVYGSDTASVVVQAFLDYTCQHCRAFESSVFPRIKSVFIDSGRVKWINKSLPHSDQGGAMFFAMGGVCARPIPESPAVEQAFFAYPIPSPKVEYEAIADAILKAGLSKSVSDTIVDCMRTRSREIQQQVVVEVQQAMSYGLRGPPAFVMDGIAFQGTMDYRTMADLLEAFLKQHQN